MREDQALRHTGNNSETHNSSFTRKKNLLPLFSTGYEGLIGSSDLLADVLGVEHLVAHFALEAAQVPVLVQRYKGLLILELLPTAAAI